MSKPLKILIDSIVDIIFPPHCQICGEIASSGLCRTCSESFKSLEPPLCEICSAPIDSAQPFTLCGRCRDFRPAYDRAWSLFVYDGEVKKAVLDFKYNGVSRLYSVFGELISERLKKELKDIKIDAVVAVPLHPSREKSRGYNQALLLARSSASLLSLPMLESELVRIRHTDFLADLGRKERYASLEGVFSLQNKISLTGKNILLVDDIMTTGATFHQCSRILKEGGASHIYGITVARTVVYDVLKKENE